MEHEHKTEQILVTGGSGYLAGWVIVGLLRSGYRVRATLRNLNRQAAVQRAIDLELGTAGRLTFCQADLLSDTGWDEAMQDIQYVLHVASPMGQNKPDGDLLTPARDGTLRVLKAASRHAVRRVVYTSSTIAATRPQPQQGVPNDEATWTDPSRKDVNNYGRSKTLAEQAAWDFIKNDPSGMTLTAILPGFILGPVLKPDTTGSVDLIYRLLAGKMPAIPNIGFPVSEVKDLVEFHLRAMTADAAENERFIFAGDFLWIGDMARLLREQYPGNAKIPKKAMPDFLVRFAALFSRDARLMAPILNHRAQFSSDKAFRLLGLRPTSASEAVLACAKSLLRHGVVA